jgi:hypothetical protein
LKESNMLAIGGLLVCVALLLLATVAPVFRSSNPPRWTTYGWVGEVVTLTIVCTLALGFGYLGAGAIDAYQTGLDYLDLGLLAAAVLGTVVLWRRLAPRARPSAFAVAANGRAPIARPEAARSDGPMATAEPVPAIASEPQPPRAA